MTFSLGWLLSRSERFLAALLADLTGQSFSCVADALVRLQTGRAESGITDVEVELSTDIAVIFEAKRGAELPNLGQLEKYAGTLSKTGASQRLLVALTNATPAYAESALPLLKIQNVRLLHRSWREIKAIAESVISHETNANKRWLSAFINYLEGLLQMETRFSNRTYRRLPWPGESRRMEDQLDQYCRKERALFLSGRQRLARPTAELYRIPLRWTPSNDPSCPRVRGFYKPTGIIPGGCAGTLGASLLPSPWTTHPAIWKRPKWTENKYGYTGMVHARHAVDQPDDQRGVD